MNGVQIKEFLAVGSWQMDLTKSANKKQGLSNLTELRKSRVKRTLIWETTWVALHHENYNEGATPPLKVKSTIYPSPLAVRWWLSTLSFYGLSNGIFNLLLPWFRTLANCFYLKSVGSVSEGGIGDFQNSLLSCVVCWPICLL